MPKCIAACAVVALAFAAPVLSEDVNPIQKVIGMLSDLQGKVTKEGEMEAKQFEEFSDWCKDQSRNFGFEIKTGNGEGEDLGATIEKADSDIGELDTKIGRVSSSIANNEADLKAGTSIRKKEHEDFEAADKELTMTIDTLDRAVMVLQRELGGSFLQKGKALATAQPVLEALTAVVSATGVSAEDQERVQSFLEQMSGDSDELEGPSGAPKGANYEKKSGGILSTLEDMLAKAEDQRSESQKEEKKSNFNFMMLKLNLEDQLATEKKQLVKAKKDKAATTEARAASQGDLDIVNRALTEDKKALEAVQVDCMTHAASYEAEQRERKAELGALAMAKKVIQEATAKPGSFVQVSAASSASLKARVNAGLSKRTKVMALLRSIAKDHHDSRIESMASKLATMVSRSSFMQTGADPFGKVRNMIQGMVEKLLQEARKEAEQKAYCDKEMKATKNRRAELEEELDDLTARMDKMKASTDQLVNEVRQLEKELADLAESQQEMDKLREKEHGEFVVVSADLKKGLEGLRMALKVLREYYAKKEGGEGDAFLQQGADMKDDMQALMQSRATHDKSQGAAGGIIAMIEVAESDFEKNLGQVETAENEAQAEYEKVTGENKMDKLEKTQDAKYKQAEIKSLEKASAQTSEDRDGVQGELDAVLEYYDKLKPQCTTKPPTYEERKKRREGEIEGLKNALSILEGEAIA